VDAYHADEVSGQRALIPLPAPRAIVVAVARRCAAHAERHGSRPCEERERANMDEQQGDRNRAPECRVTRRGFLELAGATGIGAVLPATAAAPQPTERTADVPVTLRVNGRRHQVRVEPRATLASVLRDVLRLTGTKVGCERGECGACTVLLDGVPCCCCLTVVLETESGEVTTIEGLMNGAELGFVQRAFVEEDAFQCGFCAPGQVVAADGLLRRVPEPTDDQIRLAMSGNTCRCGAYANHALHPTATGADAARPRVSAGR